MAELGASGSAPAAPSPTAAAARAAAEAAVGGTGGAGAGGAIEGAADPDRPSTLLLRRPAPTGTSRSAPPAVQYRWHACTRKQVWDQQ